MRDQVVKHTGTRCMGLLRGSYAQHQKENAGRENPFHDCMITWFHLAGKILIVREQTAL